MAEIRSLSALKLQQENLKLHSIDLINKPKIALLYTDFYSPLAS